MRYLLLLLAVLANFPAQADDRAGTVTTAFDAAAERGKGSELRIQANDLVRLGQARQFEAMKKAAVNICKAYEALFDPALEQFVFSNRSELDEFQKTYNGKFEWIDAGYKSCLHGQAFVAAEHKDFPVALQMLKRLELVAPTAANTLIETGYILGQLKRPEEGLAVYRRAQIAVDKYPSQRVYQAIVLRGIGVCLIELGRLDEAETAIRDSLKIEPGNKVALNELAYIDDLRAGEGKP